MQQIIKSVIEPPRFADEENRTLGLTIIMTLVSQLQGDFQWRNERGTSWQLIIPYQPAGLQE